MGALKERLGQDLREAMRAGDSVRRDEIRGLLAAIQAELQNRVSRELARRGLLEGAGKDEHGQPALTPEQQAAAEQVRASTHLSDEDEEAVLQTRVKQHRQSIEGFEKGGRHDLVEAERTQLAVLKVYLPQQASAADVDEAVAAAIRESGATGPRDMGKVMGVLTPRLKGRADMKLVSARVQALLTGGG